MSFEETDPFSRSFQKFMLEMRENMLCTQTDLSRSMGLTRQAISMIECGKRKASFQTFCGLAQGVGLTPAQLMGRLLQMCETEHRSIVPFIQDPDRAIEYVKKNRG